jgi:hypothetical protein
MLDKARLPPVSNTRKIVMQSICNSIRKVGQSDTDTTSHSDENVFSHKWVYTSSETQYKNDI